MNPSLLLIPDRYKASKLYSQIPDSGAGDLAFTRANDTATRVNSAGLIEKVRTNLVLYSNTFSDAAWTKVGGTTLTGSQSDPFGGSNAWKWEATGAATIQLAQNPATSNLRTASIYAKAGNISTFSMWRGSEVVFDLSTGTITSGSGTITSIGGGWYRCSVNGVGISNNPYFTAAASGEHIFVAFAQMEDGDITTDYIPTTTAAVSVGPVANIPRIDYTGGGCGKLLLEPQRTNLVTYSEQFGNAAWTKNISVTANAIASPDGSTNADKLVESASNVIQWAYQSLILTGAQTFSVYAKKGERDFVALATAGVDPCYFNLNTGVVVSTSAGATASITNAGNGWYRCVVTAASVVAPFAIVAVSDNGIRIDYAGDITKGIYVWGAQQEAGSYATSYIPTLGASVTRSADAASKTGISSLIGQSEGVIYAEILRTQSTAADAFWININDNSANNWIFCGTEGLAGRFYVRASNSVIVDEYPALSLGRHKLALAYQSGSIVGYLDGVQIFSSSSTFTIGSLTGSNLGASSPTTATAVNTAGGVIASALYPTRLTNAELASLTTL